MRRADFEIKDEAVFGTLMSECDYGTLALYDEAGPFAVPVNFAWYSGAICFHGAKEGRKAAAMQDGQKVAFSVVKPYSMVPSYFSNTRMACPATQFYVSVHIEGVVEIVKDDGEKCKLLEALMQKFQPEGGYDPIDSTNPLYTKMLAQTVLWRIVPTNISTKAKVGQNLTDERKNSVIERLSQRGSELDKATIEVIQKNGQK
jgi:nitroimidazol reductase NimA-like FMN-containing flavoprotein (pyridoxamine 5'-phosphate oxidase superfamily)